MTNTYKQTLLRTVGNVAESGFSRLTDSSDAASPFFGFTDSYPTDWEQYCFLFGRHAVTSGLTNWSMGRVDGAAAMDTGIEYSQDNVARWRTYVAGSQSDVVHGHDIYGGWFYNIYSDMSKRNLFTVSKTGRCAINKRGNVMDYHSMYMGADRTGLDDLAVSGIYVGPSQLLYEVLIVGTGTPNTFQWRTSSDNGTAWSSYSASTNVAPTAQHLSYGVFVQWGSTTGHTTVNRWQFVADSANPSSTLAIRPSKFDEVLYTPDYTVGSPVIYDYTANANSVSGTVIVLPAALTNAMYFGANDQFTSIYHIMQQAGDTGATPVYEYWDGSSWVQLTALANTLVDETSNAILTGLVSWDINTFTSSWQKYAIPGEPSGVSYYFIRFRRAIAQSFTTKAYAFARHGKYRQQWFSAAHDVFPALSVDVRGRMIFGGGTATSNSPYVQINESGTVFDSASGGDSGSLFMITSANAYSCGAGLRLVGDDPTSTSLMPKFRVSRARGSLSVPQRLSQGDIVGSFCGTGFTMDWVYKDLGDVAFMQAGTTGEHKGRILFRTGNGGNPAIAATVDWSGCCFFGGSTVPTAFGHFAAATASYSTLRLTQGSIDPTLPNAGDMWYNAAGIEALNFKAASSTKNLLYPLASDVRVTASGFTKNLTSADTTVQHALATIDQLTAGSSLVKAMVYAGV